jgi:replicative DNA helicase
MDRPVTRSLPNLPTVPDAEMGLVGSLLQDNAQAWAVRATLSHEDFYEPRCAAIYRAILACLDDRKPADLVTLTQVFTSKSAAPGIGPEQLAACMESEISGTRAAAYAELVRDAADRRRLILAARRAIETAGRPGVPTGSTRQQAEAELLHALGNRSCPRVREASDILTEVLAALDAPTDESRTVRTGYADLDKKLGGLQPGAVYVIAGRPSMGKSSLATSIVQNVAVARLQAVLLFSLEVPAKQVITNIACAESHVPNTAVRDRTLDAVMKADWKQAVERVRAAPLYIDDTPTLTASQIRSALRIECARRRLSLVIIDYLQLAGGDGNAASREREVAEICATIKQSARENEIPIIVLAQLNRESEARKGKKPVLSDLRESGAIEQDADAVLLLHREDYYKLPPAGSTASETTVFVAKNRNGPTGTVKLLFFLAWTRFEGLANPDGLMVKAVQR